MRIIRACLASDDFALHQHFVARMDERGLFLPDVLAIINAPSRVRMDGQDGYGRDRCIVTGKLTDQTVAELVAVIEPQDDGEFTVFITIYWE